MPITSQNQEKQLDFGIKLLVRELTIFLWFSSKMNGSLPAASSMVLGFSTMLFRFILLILVTVSVQAEDTKNFCLNKQMAIAVYCSKIGAHES